jgi:hypothetical protein
MFLSYQDWWGLSIRANPRTIIRGTDVSVLAIVSPAGWASHPDNFFRNLAFALASGTKGNAVFQVNGSPGLFPLAIAARTLN